MHKGASEGNAVRDQANFLEVGMGMSDKVTSRMNVYHMDSYRLKQWQHAGTIA